jgi:alkylation response protein AidB-like acyl-CoA dehydrogenase
MEFEFDEDQRLLQQSVRETLAKIQGQPEDQLWATYLELGWLEAPPVELAIVLEELGYIADPTPFLATATWFAPLAGRVPDGSGTGVFDGAGRFVLDADRAAEVALLTADGVRVVPGEEVTSERVSTFDHRLHVAHVTGLAGAGLAGTGLASTGPAGADLVRQVPDLALAGLAVSTVGACRKILDLVVAHVKQRHQFGVPIGSFQAVKHKCADMYVAIERARALAYFSALTIAEDDPQRTRAAHMAKAAAGDCQRLVFANGFQLFGAMGFTWENELQIYLKRVLAGDLLLGTASEHKRALLAGLDAPAEASGGDSAAVIIDAQEAAA